MKKFLLGLACCLFTGSIAYVCGYHNAEGKSYRAACVMSDALRCLHDAFEEDTTLRIGDYEDIVSTFLIDYQTGLDVNLEDYVTSEITDEETRLVNYTACY